MSTRNARIGTIIKVIGNHPGITLTQLHAELLRHGIKITERTLAKDILLLKHEYELLPAKDRLRSGYVLQHMYTLASNEVGLIVDAMHVFGACLDDPEAIQMMHRLQAVSHKKQKELLSAEKTRTVRHRNIYRMTKDEQQIQSLLLSAIRSRLPVKFAYHTPRLMKPQNVRGYPLLMVFHERGWYCIVKDIADESYYPRRLDRIRSCTQIKAEANSSHFKDVQQAQFLISCGWGMTFPHNLRELEESDNQPEIIVRFDKTIAPYILESVERHPRGKVVPMKDGSGDVQFKIRLGNSDEFRYWVRAFGEKAWIVAPQSLVENERAELRRMERRYFPK